MRAYAALAAVMLTVCGFEPALAEDVPEMTETSLRAADELQRSAVAAGDVEPINAMMHPQYRVNAPTNRVMTREDILAMFEEGIITAEPVERIVEAALVSGTTGLVMGLDRLVPPPGSALAQAFGEGPILRRFTNVYSFENDRWWFLARHFTQAPE